MVTLSADNDDAVPPGLLQYRNCAPWRAERTKDGKTSKRFYNPCTLGRKLAEADAPATTSGWVLAKQRMLKLLDTSFGVQPEGGMGILLGVDQADGTTIGGGDLDSCYAGGKLTPWAAEIIELFSSYAEISPSGTGVKVFFRYRTVERNALKAAVGGKCTLWRGAGTNGGGHSPGIEIYFDKRFFTVTGNRFGDCRELPIISAATVEWLKDIAAKLPRGAKAGGTAGGKKRTNGSTPDRSAMAASLLIGLLRANADLTFDEGMAALAGADEQLIVEWYEEQDGSKEGDRQLQRHWDFAVKSAAELRERDAARKTFSEDGLALEFVARYHDRLRYCHTTGAWFVWTGKAWRKDETQQVYTLARRTCRDVAARPKATTGIKDRLGKASTVSAVVKLAMADEMLAVTAAIWDADPYLLGTPDGTVDLRTGKLSDPTPEDYITKLTATVPADRADCPLWRKFLGDVTCKDASYTRYLQRWLGYTLVGATIEQRLLFIFGPGGNGKGVFKDTAANILGEYATTAPIDTFTESRNDRHPADLAKLAGARMVTASETEAGHSWSENRLKLLTGGDKIPARFMHQNFFEYLPQFALTIIGNHKPNLKGVNAALKRRFDLAPFTWTPPEVDLKLEEKLRDEWPGILRWMIDGSLDWQREGLIRPTAVTEATKDYFVTQDAFGAWLAERCSTAPQHGKKPEARVSDLRADFTVWSESNGEKRPNRVMFKEYVQGREGLRYKTVKGQDVIEGARLKTATELHEERKF